MQKHYKGSKERRRTRVRSKTVGTRFKPRLNVFRSNKYTFAQLIDDVAGITVATVPLGEIKDLHKGKSKVDAAREVGKSIAKYAREKEIKRVIFDRGMYKYHGRVKSLAEGAREAGLTF